MEPISFVILESELLKIQARHAFTAGTHFSDNGVYQALINSPRDICFFLVSNKTWTSDLFSKEHGGRNERKIR